MTERIVSDVSALPTYEFGAKSPIWWGTLGFVALEGMGFAIAAAMYLYLAAISQDWPLGAPPPDLLPGTLTTAILLASAIPNRMVDRWARAEDLRLVRIGLVVMCAFGIAPLIVRIFEFRALHVSWDTNAYGSVTWLLLGLHASHLLTDLGDTLVLTALMFTRYGHSGKRFSDVSDNAFYWDFVVASWVLLYILLYWFPRVWSP